jgi:hypothetical protein
MRFCLYFPPCSEGWGWVLLSASWPSEICSVLLSKTLEMVFFWTLHNIRGTNPLHHGLDFLKFFYPHRLSKSFINKHSGLESVLSWAQTESDHATGFSTRACLFINRITLHWFLSLTSARLLIYFLSWCSLFNLSSCVIFRFRVSAFIRCNQLLFVPSHFVRSNLFHMY